MTVVEMPDYPMRLTTEERALIVAWLNDQAETWANVGDRPMLSAIAVLREQAEEEPEEPACTPTMGP